MPVLVLALLALGLVTPELAVDPWGRFTSPVRVEWRNDGALRLLEPLTYEDPDGTAWLAPADSVADGGSIPRVAWSLAGDPFGGRWRNAVVLHDVACAERRRPWRAVHRMFYFACRAAGLDSVDAKVLYGAAALFGSRWPAPQPGFSKPGAARGAPASAAYAPPLSTTDDFLRLRAHVEAHADLTLDDIDALDRAALMKAVPTLPPARHGPLHPQ